ncbi:hypothetical protein [Bailinhaonella thermotolerans]|uniref:Uncharacterized protein n=1 Tax=Bailinhaonella thermotolerans TaxID=1070861 RepID=A0A3A4A6C4_9ACTN|nr:hypothetical protein [Bailinhaonella thermotolerans]RJL21251.1 hypothetical protein D5H75_37935 [Bailinhaonella thermotolerans]
MSAPVTPQTADPETSTPICPECAHPIAGHVRAAAAMERLCGDCSCSRYCCADFTDHYREWRAALNHQAPLLSLL